MRVFDARCPDIGTSTSTTPSHLSHWQESRLPPEAPLRYFRRNDVNCRCARNLSLARSVHAPKRNAATPFTTRRTHRTGDARCVDNVALPNARTAAQARGIQL
jgi:hypothetical protein